MKLQSILLLTGIAAGLLTVSCKSVDDEAQEFFGTRNRKKAKTEDTAEDKAKNDYYNQINAHIDRRLNEFNEKEEAKLPVFSSKEVRDEFMDLSFIKSAMQIKLLSMDFAGPLDIDYKFLVNRDNDSRNRWLIRTVGDKTEIFTFETFTNGIPLAIPHEVHILYAFATNFNRIAETVTLRCFEKLERGENPAIADLENEANIDEKGRKKDKNFVEIKPKTTSEPLEFRIDNRWCKCYDVKLKNICEPFVSMSLFVSNEEKTISRVDFVLDDDFKISYILDWREQDGIVLPRVIRRLDDNAVFFRDDAKALLVGEAEALDGLKEKTENLKTDLAEAESEAASIGYNDSTDSESITFENAEEVIATWDSLKNNLEILKPSLNAEETAAVLAEIRTEMSIVKTKYRNAESELFDAIAKIERIKEAIKEAEDAAESDIGNGGEAVEIDASGADSDDTEEDSEEDAMEED